MPAQPRITHSACPNASFEQTIATSIWSPCLTTQLPRCDSLIPEVTVQQAISDIPSSVGCSEYSSSPVSQYQHTLRSAEDKLTNHTCVSHSSRVISQLGSPPYGPGSPVRMANRPCKNRLQWDSPFATIICKPKWKNHTVIHPMANRVISVRESARAQSFPDSYIFVGKTASTYRQIGNSMPPMLAAAIAKTFTSMM